MNKIVLVSILCLMIVSNSLIGQRTQHAPIPYHVTADSLYNYYWKGVDNAANKNSVYKKVSYNNSWNHRLDTAFAMCEDYMIDCLGKNVFFKYVQMTTYGFRFAHPNIQKWTFYFQYPVSSQIRQFVFTITLKADSSIAIDYPHHLPDCNGLPDCGFISQDKVIKLAKENGFLKDSDKYRIFIDDYKYSWIVEKTLIEGWEWDQFSVHLLTGEAKHIGISRRID